jgi:hypothetical protein
VRIKQSNSPLKRGIFLYIPTFISLTPKDMSESYDPFADPHMMHNPDAEWMQYPGENSENNKENKAMEHAKEGNQRPAERPNQKLEQRPAQMQNFFNEAINKKIQASERDDEALNTGIEQRGSFALFDKDDL